LTSCTVDILLITQSTILSEKINAQNAQNEMMSIWGMERNFRYMQQEVIAPTFFIAIMMVVIQRCVKYSNESVSTTQRSLSLQNNITERKSMTRRAGGLAFADKIKTSKQVM